MNTKFLLCFILLASILTSCTEFRLYRDNKFSSGLYTQEETNSIRKYLSFKTGLVLKDTVIIKYDFNNDGCWSILDQQNPEYIKKVINGFNENISEYKQNHLNTSVLTFKESGNNFNKIKKWDKNIFEDDGFLRKKVFTKLTTCGTSFKLYPNGKYELIYSDSHFNILDEKHY